MAFDMIEVEFLHEELISLFTNPATFDRRDKLLRACLLLQVQDLVCFALRPLFILESDVIARNALRVIVAHAMILSVGKVNAEL